MAHLYCRFIERCGVGHIGNSRLCKACSSRTAQDGSPSRTRKARSGKLRGSETLMQLDWHTKAAGCGVDLALPPAANVRTLRMRSTTKILLLWQVVEAVASPTGSCVGSSPYVSDLIVPLCARSFPDRSSLSTSWVLHFYAGNCRRCRELAVLLHEVASAPSTLRKGIKLGSLDCHDASNANLCKHYKVWKFPVLMILSSKARYKGPFEGSAIIDWLSEVNQLGVLPPASQKMSVCPAFQLYEEPQERRAKLLGQDTNVSCKKQSYGFCW